MLTAGTGRETLVAGTGADTLVGNSSGTDVFSFVNEAAGRVYLANAFAAGDSLSFANTNVASYAESHQTVVSGSIQVVLQDSTVIMLRGILTKVTAAAFAHP